MEKLILRTSICILITFLGFKNLTAVVMFSVFGNITPCRLFEAIRRSGGICLLRLQGRRISQARKQRESSSRPRDMFPPKRLLTFNRLHSVISQNTGFLILLFSVRFTLCLSVTCYGRICMSVLNV
jgi:hypothetical protein